MSKRELLTFTARYEKEDTPDGIRYTFFCGVSGAAVYTTDPICAADENAALEIAKREAKRHFNFCWECGVWIGDKAYNIDEMKCVNCAPFTVVPRYCPECGSPVRAGSEKCPRCESLISAEQRRRRA
jgi:predicted nucleic acid-binding Zn ribbon protein